MQKKADLNINRFNCASILLRKCTSQITTVEHPYDINVSCGLLTPFLYLIHTVAYLEHHILFIIKLVRMLCYVSSGIRTSNFPYRTES